MITAIIICSVYISILFVLAKLFGVKYTDVIKSTANIKNGIIFPIGISTLLLIIFAGAFSYLPSVLHFSPQVNIPVLWIVPAITIISIVARFTKARWNYFEKKGLVLLIIGVAIIGISEELLVRGITVSALQDGGFSIFWTGIISSLIFGILHFSNYFNGQDLKKTTIQVGGTFLMGLNFYILLVISGSLWLPIILHALYDLSILALGPDPKFKESIGTTVITITTIGLFLLPIVGFIFLLPL